jgi:hypothetical protein
MEARKPRKRRGFGVGNPNNRGNPFFEQPRASASPKVGPRPPPRPIEDWTAHHTAALQARLADNLTSGVHALAHGVFYSAMPIESVLRIESSGADRPCRRAGRCAKARHGRLVAGDGGRVFRAGVEAAGARRRGRGQHEGGGGELGTAQEGRADQGSREAAQGHKLAPAILRAA